MSLENAYDAVFAGLSRLGPGSERSTRKALSLLPPLPETGTVLDLGCGTGASTLVLAKAQNRPILASDVSACFLDTFKQRVRAAGAEKRISISVASADATGQPPESAALIWCEGAIFTVGVEKGLRHWHSILKPGGAVAFTELTWFGKERPAEADAFFSACYPPMTDPASLLSLCLGCGYRFEAMFALPQADWRDEYYTGLRPALDRYRGSDDPDIRHVVEECDREIELDRMYGTSYGYSFVILSKI